MPEGTNAHRGGKIVTATQLACAAGFVLFAPVFGEAAAQSAKTVDIIDFLVDRDDLVGQTVTVSGCRFGAASDSQVLCAAVGGQGNVPIDSKSLNKEDLRKALRQCSAFTALAPESCAGSVTGTVMKGQFGFRLTKAAIGWRPST